MNLGLNKTQAQRSQKELRSLQWWEQERAKGKSRFVLRAALMFGPTMVVTTDIVDILSGGGASIDRLLSRFICFSVTGILIGCFGWSHWEEKYKEALQKARVANQVSN